MCIDKLEIKSNIKNYKAYFEENSKFIKELAEKLNTVFVVDENVWENHKGNILSPLADKNLIVLAIKEEYKNIETVCKLYSEIMKYSPRKNLNLVSIGGGITQDLTGFVASSLYRGINWIFIPTTLLAQVDSCIGAKTSLNFNHYKNLIGTFYPPTEIHIYPEFLKTLKREDYYSGVGEMAKLHLMNGEDYTKIFVKSLDGIEKLDSKILLERTKACLEIKKSYIESDEFDTGKRNLLNYGHCFGHAIESSTNFAISHGEAVVLGMILANKESLKRGILSEQNERYIREQVLEPSLVVKIPQIHAQKTVEAMKQDKKNLGTGLALVMLKDEYEMVKITDLDEDEAVNIIEEFKQENNV